MTGLFSSNKVYCKETLSLSKNSYLTSFRNKNAVCNIISAQTVQKILQLNTKVKTRANGSAQGSLCSYSWMKESKIGSFTLVLSPYDASKEIFPPKKLNKKEMDNEILKTIEALKKQTGNKKLSMDDKKIAHIVSALKAANQYEFIQDIGDGATISNSDYLTKLMAVEGNTRLKLIGKGAFGEVFKQIAQHILK